MTNFLSFLGSGVELQEVPVTKSRPKSSVDNNPNGTFPGFRLWHDGSVYPSQALVDQFKLEYPKAVITTEPVMKDDKPVFVKDNKVVEEGTEGAVPKIKKTYEYTEKAFGFDWIDSAEWTQLPKAEDTPRGFLIAVVEKPEPKVDLFAGVRYKDDGTPLQSVMTQGANTFGSDIIASVNEVCGITMGKEVGEVPYVDFKIATPDLKAICKNGIFLLPKKVVRGELKGKTDYTRRENVSIFGLEPIPAKANEAPAEEDQA